MNIINTKDLVIIFNSFDKEYLAELIVKSDNTMKMILIGIGILGFLMIITFMVIARATLMKDIILKANIAVVVIITVILIIISNRWNNTTRIENVMIEIETDIETKEIAMSLYEGKLKGMYSEVSNLLEIPVVELYQAIISEENVDIESEYSKEEIYEHMIKYVGSKYYRLEID